MGRRLEVSKLSCSRTVAILLLLVLSPFFATNAQAQASSGASRYADHGFADLQASDRVTFSLLNSLTNGSTSVFSFERVIQDAYLSLGVHEILLDIGWENFTAGKPPYEAWVSNWFTASDAMGLSNVLYVGQLTSQGFNSPWINSLISADPSASTYYINGTRANFVSLDNPAVADYLEVDLGILFSYYGNYSSWVGLSTGSSQSNPYYATSESMPTIGYSNLSISSFVNSRYYNADVNATGYLPDGALDALWSEYRDVQPGVVLSSGLWMTSSPYEVYGSGTESSFVEMRFEIPSNATTLQIQWYGNEVGNPGNLEVAIFGDSDGNLNPSEKLTSLTATASDFNSTTGWQGGIQATGNFSAGWYWVEFSSPSSDQSNYYTFYLRDYVINNATAWAAQSAAGPGFEQGSTILWLKNQAGNNLVVYPYQEAYVGGPTQTFTATHAFSFNTVFLFLSDRGYNPLNATLTITDITDGNRVVATGLLSQALDQGLENWVPIALNGTVSTVRGDEYVLSIDDPSITWTTVMRYVVTSPPQAGFQNQSQTLLFELGNLNWTQGVKGLGAMTTLGDSPTTGTTDAVRFSPTGNETVKSVQILMYNTEVANNSDYTSGTISLAILGSNAAGSAPQGSPLQQFTVPATSVPHNGFLKVSGFDVSVTAGKDYWVVFSANSTETFTLARLTSPYEFLFSVSNDKVENGAWVQASDGPTEIAFVISLSQETLGTYVAGQTETTLGSTSIFAQPFVASSSSPIEGVYIGPLVPGPRLIISIVPTASSGEPELSPLASGLYDAGNITLDYGPEFVQFSSVAYLQQGKEYWITIQPIGGSYEIASLLYLKSDPDLATNAAAQVSDNNGLGWKAVSNDSATVDTIPEYLLETATTTPPQFDTKEIASDLATNHDFPVSSGLLKGWNAYVQASELNTYSEVAQQLSSLAGKDFEFYTNAQANVASQLNLKDIALLPALNSTTTCQQALGAEDSAIVSNDNPFTYAPISTLEQCSSAGAKSLTQELNYIAYSGGHFGLNTANNVLVVGDQPNSNLTSYLSNAFNVTYVNFNLDSGLQNPSDLSSFKAIVWITSSNETISSAVSDLLSEYVRRGGELVTTDATLADLFAFTPVASAKSQVVSLNASSFLETALVHTEYANYSFQETVSSTTLAARSANLTLAAAVMGSGRFVFVDFGNSSLPVIGDQSVVISNMVAGAANGPSPLWYQTDEAAASSADEYSVQGAYGRDLLVWVYNPSATPSAFMLDLNGSYYGISQNWKTVQVPDLNVTDGVGSDVEVRATVAPETLVGILVVPSSEPLISYSSASVESQYAYPDQSLYSISAKVNQSVLVIISTNDSASQILLNDSKSIPDTTSIGQFSNASMGWYFDSRTDSLFVRYQSSGLDNLRFVFYSSPVPTPSLVPLRTLYPILVLAVVLEVIAVASLALRHRKRQLDRPVHASSTDLPRR